MPESNHIVQHIPGSCDGFEPKRCDFDSQDDLLGIEWVKKWGAHEDHHRYSLSGDMLMVERDQGAWWWVIGRVKYPKRLDLSKWVAPTQERR